jgi:hypothetical protein
MKEEVERKKDEVKNMTMMILNEDRNLEFTPSGTMILGELDANQEERLIDTSVGQSRSNMASLNTSNNNNNSVNTTINFVKRNISFI